MIERTHPTLSVGAQCRLLSISRSSFYYSPQGETAMNLDLMMMIDKQFLDPSHRPPASTLWGFRVRRPRAGRDDLWGRPMTALPKSTLPAHIRNEVARLKGAGFPLLPLGGGDDGKTPLTRAWAGPVMPLAQVLGPMHRTGSRAYGVRLDVLAVVDCDSADAALVADLEARFGPSPVHVRTPRGMHLYYRAVGPAPNLRGEGLPVDLKTGGRAYVVGPLSERRDGGMYVPERGLLGVDVLPPLRPVSGPLATSATVLTGQRHVALVREAIRMVEYVDSAGELAANLCGLRDDLCGDPATMPDSELRAIAGWAWKCRLEGRIFKGRDSEVKVNRLALDALLPLANGPDALALLMILIDRHGHAPGKRFALSHGAMRKAGLTTLSRPRFLAARRSLEGAGLLRLAQTHRAGSRAQAFVLTRLRPHGIDAVNVAEMPAQGAGKERGKGL